MDILKIDRVRYGVFTCCIACFGFLLGRFLFNDLRLAICFVFWVIWAGICYPLIKRCYQRTFACMKKYIELNGPPKSRIDNEYDGYDEYGDDDDEDGDKYSPPDPKEFGKEEST